MSMTSAAAPRTSAAGRYHSLCVAGGRTYSWGGDDPDDSSLDSYHAALGRLGAVPARLAGCQVPTPAHMQRFHARAAACRDLFFADFRSRRGLLS